MKRDKVAKFMALAGQKLSDNFHGGSEAERKLGAQLLLSEVLEYVIDGLGVTPEINGIKVTDPEAVHYHAERSPDPAEMLDGLADVAYTMYWNANAFGVPLEAGYELVCDNNLEKFVKLDSWAKGLVELPPTDWHCRCGAGWPEEVVRVAVVELNGEWYAVGKDARGKVRKPLHFKAVDLSHLL
jgi:hypothetical protein